MALPPDQLFDAPTYFETRLRTVSRARDLDEYPSVRFDLAASNLTDDELEVSAEAFGAPPSERFGMSAVWQELLSRDPLAVSVEDIGDLESRLQVQGYLPDTYQPTGVWNPQAHAAFERWERDSNDMARSGAHPLATTAMRAIEAIGYTLPANVLKGIVGMSKGLVEQAPETAERLGILGTAGVGAGAGAAIGTSFFGVGALPGALIGGAAGAVGGLVSEVLDTEDQGMLEKFVPLPSEYENVSQLWEDIGFIATAASLVSGVGIGARGVAGGTAALQAAQTAGRSGNVIRSALFAKPFSTQPGFLAKLSGAGAKKLGRTLGEGGAARGFERFGSFILEQSAKRGLMTQASRPLFRTINGAYTGLSTAQMGGRLAAGIGQKGDVYKDPFALERGRKLIDEEGSTIAEAIEDERWQLPGGEWTDNLASLVLYPTQFLPLSARALRNGVEAATGDSQLWTYYQALKKPNADGIVPSDTEIRKELIPRLLDPDWKGGAFDRGQAAVTHLWLRKEFGLKMHVGEQMNRAFEEGADVAGIVNSEQVGNQFRIESIKRLRREAEEGQDGFLRHLLSYSDQRAPSPRYGPAAYTAWLSSSDIERMPEFVWANRELQRITRTHLDPSDPFRAQTKGRAAPYEGPGEVQMARWEIKANEDRLKEVDEYLSSQALRPTDRTKAVTDREQLKARQKYLNDLVEGVSGEELAGDEVFLPMRLPEYRDEAGVINSEGRGRLVRAFGHTQQDIVELRDRYEAAHQNLRQAHKAFETRPSETAQQALTDAGDAYRANVDELRLRELIPDRMVDEARLADTPKKVSNLLTEKARHHAREVSGLPDDLMRGLSERGYKPVAANSELMYFDEASDLMRIHEVGDYTRRAKFIDTLGMSVRKPTDRSLFAMRLGSERNEVFQVLSEEGIPLTGRQASRRIHEWLNENNAKALIPDSPEESKVGAALTRPLTTVKEALRYKIDVRELNPDMLKKALRLDEFGYLGLDEERVAKKVYGALKRGAAFGGDADLRSPIQAVRMLAKATRANGLPGFSDWMRTWHVPESLMQPGVKRVAGAAVGGAVGAELAERREGGLDAWQGATLGMLGGAIAGPKVAKGKYGYLPDTLHRVNMTLRYTLSPVFDAGRYMEQNMLGMAKAELPPIFNPRKAIMRRAKDWGMDGEEAWQKANQYYDSLTGSRFMQVIDDVDRRMFQRGMLGFSPRHHEAAQAFMLKQRGWKDSKIEETVAQIGRYGLGRTGLEKSVNFVFFPYSFSQKFIRTLGDVVFQAPARNFLVYEGLRRFEEAGAMEASGDWIERHVPLAKQLYRINNLAFGLSPGRFFLEGLDDNRTNVGKAMQILSSVFVPSGAATPVAQGFGGLGDMALNFFTPVVVVGEDVNGLDDILRRYVPAMRDFEQFYRAGREQATALTAGAAPYSQMQDYFDERRAIDDMLDDVAERMGYASGASMLNSTAGAGLRPAIEAAKNDITVAHPDGAALAARFENPQALDEAAMKQLFDKQDRSPAEDAIVQFKAFDLTVEQVATRMNMAQGDVRAVVSPFIRRLAVEHGDDKRFRQLWGRFFEPMYGPVEMQELMAERIA